MAHQVEKDRLLAEALQRRFSGQDRHQSSMYDLEEDRKLAEKLQKEEEAEYRSFNATKPSSSAKREPSTVDSAQLQRYKELSPVDPSWETTDPTPDIYSLFKAFNDSFFWSKLTSCEVRWSAQMTTCAGLCCYSPREGFCSIRLSKPLLTLRPRRDLVETLLHEMIHAYLFLTHQDREARDRNGHGTEFHRHMFRINAQTGANITVYHNFTEEVRYFKVHHWRCDGPCRFKHPFYGWVKRSRNRTPSANDFWWSQHQRDCGGTFVKVNGPELKDGKKNNRKRKDLSADGSSVPKRQRTTAVSNNSIPGPSSRTTGTLDKVKKTTTTTTPFSGSGNVLGSTGTLDSSQSPRDARLFPNGGDGQSPTKRLRQATLDETMSLSKPSLSSKGIVRPLLNDSLAKKVLETFSDSDDEENTSNGRSGRSASQVPDIIICLDDTDEMANCPVCSVNVPLSSINDHLDRCVSS